MALWGLALAAASEAAQEHEQEESPSVLTVRTSVKATGLVSRAPDAPDLFSERTTAQSMVRFRIEPEIHATKNMTFNVGYEQRLHYASGVSGIAAIGILPSAASTPFRVEPLVWRVTDSGDGTWRHEIDRANAQDTYDAPT